MGSSSKSGQPSGYKYFLTMHMGLCLGPIDALVVIEVDQKAAWGGNVTDTEQADWTLYNESKFGGSPYTTIAQAQIINRPDLFGGDTQEGGIVGGFNVYMGKDNQALSPADVNVMGHPTQTPGFRGIVSIMYGGQVSSNNPYLKPWSFRVQRSTKGWDELTGCWNPTKAKINISVCRLEFYYAPVVGQWIDFNGTKITWIASGTPTAYEALYDDLLAQCARNLAETINNNPSIYQLYAETYPDVQVNAASTTVVLTSLNPQPPISGSGNYPITTNATNSNPLLYTNGLQVGGIQAMNPAHILYEICTNRKWGRGLPVVMMNDESFRQAADRLYNEGFGLCMKWNQQDTLASFTQDVIDHISAAMYMDRNTGQVTLRLLRQDYDPTNIAFFDVNSGLLSVDNDASSARPAAYNEVIVNGHDPVQNIDFQVRAQDNASFAANQSTVSVTKDYHGIPTPALAAQAALRDLLVGASGLKRFTFKFDRSARFLGPGSVFAFSDATRQIQNMVMRVAKVQDGSPKEQTITITAVQDVFGLPATAFMGANPVAQWTPPPNQAVAVAQRYVAEATYRDMAYYLPTAQLTAYSSSSGGIATLAVNPGITSGTYKLNTSVSGGATNTGIGTWTFGATLAVAIGLGDTEITLQNPVNLSVVPATGGAPFGLMVDGEWMLCTSWDTVTGIFQVDRGCVDTLPSVHAVNAPVWLADYYEASDNIEYLSGEDVAVKMLPLTSQGSLDPSDAPTDTVNILARWAKPYPPGKLTLNGDAYYSTLPIFTATDITVAWAERNRVTQADVMVGQLAATIAPETGTTYTITISDASHTVLRTETGLTGTSWVYTEAMQSSDGLSGIGFLTLESVLDGVASFQQYNVQFQNAVIGWGNDWGYNWGGGS